PPTTQLYPLSLHDALPISWGIFRVHDTRQPDLVPLPGQSPPPSGAGFPQQSAATGNTQQNPGPDPAPAFLPDGSVNTDVVTSTRSEEHTSELQSRENLVCR